MIYSFISLFHLRRALLPLFHPRPCGFWLEEVEVEEGKFSEYNIYIYHVILKRFLPQS